GSYQREKEDLSYYLFENIDFSEHIRHISFFRSDFRGSKFTNVYFYKNNLDRADFISACFTKCSFKSANFGGCEIKNCYFENTVFDNNLYKDASIQQSIFNNCVFSDEKFLVSMYDCSFINCKIKNCSFEMSTTEKLSFNRCFIENVDFATMHAEMHSFIHCDLRNVCIGSSYIFGYLICHTNLENMVLLYRGEKVSLDKSNIQSLYSQERFYEFINANILLGNYNIILPLIKESFKRLVDFPQFIRKSEIENILNCIIFYFKNEVIPFHQFVDIFHFFTNNNWQQFDISERINYLSKLEVLRIMLESGEYDYNFIQCIPNVITSKIEMFFQTEDHNSALESSKTIFDIASEILNFKFTYSLISERKGSWILLYTIPTVVVFLIPKIIREFHNLKCTMKIQNSLCDRIIKQLEKTNLNTKDIAYLAHTAKIALLNEKKDELSEALKLIKLIEIDI
ncbi:MAG: pentapeptide repeat-containing protein, partial [Candidatus Cloacimonetes bacterium]|nr:pentapeptide repeat-containing protein [Candidatus Cloacimonadota bacterium]